MDKRKLLIPFLVLILTGTSFLSLATLHHPDNVPFAMPSNAPESLISNPAYINATLNGYTLGTANSGQSVLDSTTSVDFYITTSESGNTWSGTHSGNGYISSSSGSFQLDDIAVQIPKNNQNLTYAFTTITATLTIGTATYTKTWSDNYVGSSGYALFNPVWTSIFSTGETFSYTLQISVTAPSWLTGSPSGTAFTSNAHTGGNAVLGSASYTSVTGFTDGLTYDGQSVTATWSNPANTQALNFSFSFSGSSGLSDSGLDLFSTLAVGDYYSGNIPSSATFSMAGTYSDAASFTFSWSTTNVVVSATDAVGNTTGVSQNPSENQNWWNSTISAKFTPPAWLNGNSVDGKTWNTHITWTIAHVLSAGYETNPNFDTLYYSGSTSGSDNLISSLAQYPTINGNTETANSAYTITYSIAELINYNPQITSVTTSWKSGSTVTLNWTDTEQITQNENIVINWGDGGSTSFDANQVSTQTFSKNHTYSGSFSGSFNQAESISITVNNLPNAPSSSYGSAFLSVTKDVSSYTISSTLDPTTPQSILLAGQYVYMNVTNQNISYSSASVTINGASFTPIQVSSTTASQVWKVTTGAFGSTNVIVDWTLVGGRITVTQSISYGTNLIPSSTSQTITAVTWENTTTKSTTSSGLYYTTVRLQNAQSTATVQNFDQQMTIDWNLFSSYLSSDVSNVRFYIGTPFTTGTEIYGWMESGNSNTATNSTVWLNLGSSTIPAGSEITVYLVFFSISENFGNHWGEAPQLSSTYGQYDNGASVFPFYFNGDVSTSNWQYTDTSGSGTPTFSHTSATINGNSVTLMTITTPSSTHVILAYNGATIDNQNLIVEGYVHTDGGSSAQGLIGLTSSPTSTSFIGVGDQFSGSYFDEYIGSGSGGDGLTTLGTSTSNWVYSTLQYTKGGSTFYGSNAPQLYSTSGGYSGSNSNTVSSSAGSLYYMVYGDSGGGSTLYINWVRMREMPPDNVMPTAMTSQSVLSTLSTTTYSNTTTENVGHITANTPTPYASNLSDGLYTYQIPDSFNSPNITVYYNDTWTFFSSSYGNYQNLNDPSRIYYTGTTGIGFITVTFIEPITIGEPLGTMSLGVLPTIAVSGLGFFELPANYLKWEAGGFPVNPNGFSVVVGKAITINAYTASNELVYSTSYTPTQLDSFLQTSVNVSEVQFNNLNSTDEVQVSAVQNGTTQYEMLLAPYGTGASSGNLYIPSGNYTYRYTQLNYTTGAVINGGTQTAKPVYQNGMYWVTLNGFTIYDLGNQLTYTNSSIQKSIQTLSVQIYLNDSAIKQLAVNLSLNMTFVNSTIQDQFTQILSNFTFENSLINGQNITLQGKISAVDSIIKAENLNISDNFTITNSYIRNENISLQDRFQILSSSLGNLTFNDSQYFKLEQDSIKNLNLNLSNNFTLTNDIINNFNVSSLNRFDVLDSNIGNMSFNVTQYYTLEQDSIRNLNLNLSDNFSLTNNAIKNVNISQYNRFEILKSNVGNLTFNVSSYYDFEQSSFKDLNINLSDNFSITDSIINNFNLTQKTRFTILNSSISNLTVNASTYFKLERDAINNLNLNLSDNFTLTNSYINNANISQYNRYEVLNSSINNLNFSETSYFTLLNSSVKNLSLSDKQYFNIVNSSINNFNLSLATKISLVNDSIHNLNLSDVTRTEIIDSAISSMNLSISTQQSYTDELVNISAYVFILGSPVANGTHFMFPVYVEQKNSSTLANLSITRDAASNMDALYAYQGAVNVNYTVSNLTAGFFDLSLYLSPLQVRQMQNGSFVSLSSPIVSGAVSTVAAGKIVSTDLPSPLVPWYQKYFGIGSPPPGGIADFSWFVLSIPGILSTGILGAIILLFYTRNLIHGLRKEKQEREEAEKQKKEFEEMRKDIKEMKEKQESTEGA